MSREPASVWLPNTALRQLIYVIFISVYVWNFTSASFSFLICKKGKSWLSVFPDLSLFSLSLYPHLISCSRLGNRLSPCSVGCQGPEFFFTPHLPWQPGSGGECLCTGSVEGIVQAGNELIGREMACSCLGAAAQCFKVFWGSLSIFCPLLVKFGKLCPAFFLISSRATSGLWALRVLNTQMRGRKTALFPCSQSCRDPGVSSSFPSTHCQAIGHNDRTLSGESG